MSQNINDLCADPLFQLNLAIWLTQPIPSQIFPYFYPLFYNSELNLHSISPTLSLPLDIRNALSSVSYQSSAKPDLVIKGRNNILCILECKGSSFGPDTKQAKQAKTLLLIAGPIISEVVVGGKRWDNEGILLYLSSSNQIEMVENTLKTLAQELKNLKLEPGNYGCFGIKPEQGEILLEYSEQIKDFLKLKDSSPVRIMEITDSTDPRPLYFIPYDPNIQQTQQERKICKKILFERILSEIISRVGRADIPSSISFKSSDILNSATFGLYDKWEDKEAKKHLDRLLKNFLLQMKDNINKLFKEHIINPPPEKWSISLKDRKIKEQLCKLLMKFKIENLTLSEDNQPKLFEEMDQ